MFRTGFWSKPVTCVRPATHSHAWKYESINRHLHHPSTSPYARNPYCTCRSDCVYHKPLLYLLQGFSSYLLSLLWDQMQNQILKWVSGGIERPNMSRVTWGCFQAAVCPSRRRNISVCMLCTERALRQLYLPDVKLGYIICHIPHCLCKLDSGERWHGACRLSLTSSPFLSPQPFARDESDLRQICV